MTETYKDFLLEVRKRYESKNGTIDNKSRLRKYVEHRFAIVNAVRPFCTHKIIGELFEKDHSSMVYYTNQHEPLLKWSADYVRNFADASEIVDEVSSEMGLLPTWHGNSMGYSPIKRINDIERVILMLHQLRDKIVVKNFPQKKFGINESHS